MEQQKSKNSLRICKNCKNQRLIHKDNLCFICFTIQNQKKDGEEFFDIDLGETIWIKLEGGEKNNGESNIKN